MADFVLATQGGSVSIVLPSPGPGIERTPEIVGGTRTTGGGRDVQHVIRVKRSYTLAWEFLTEAEWAPIEAFVLREHGLGPFEFTWPGRSPVLVNILSSPDTSPLAETPDGLLAYHNVSLTLREV